jgi:streptogramin lyase
VAGAGVLTPSDPDAFRTEVMRRALRIERRRRRTRALMAAPAVVAVLLLAVVIRQRDAEPSETVQASAPLDIVTVEERTLPDGLEPWAVVGATDGATWVLSLEPEPTMTRVSTDGGEPATFPLPSDAAPDELVAGAGGAVWMTDPAARRVLHVDTDGDVTSWPTDGEPSAGAAMVAGRLWYAEAALDRISGVAPDGDVVHHDVPRGRQPTDVGAGPDGAIWYGSGASPTIGSVSPTGVVNEVELDDPAARATALTTGPGPALWMLVSTPDGVRLGHLDAQGQVVTDEVASPSPPSTITSGPNGRIWFSAGDGTIQEQTASRLSVVRIGRPLDAGSWAVAGDDSVWAVDRARHQLLRIIVD